MKPMFGDPIGPWRDHFSWLPVKLFDGTRIWLRWVKRRAIQKHFLLPGGCDRWWQYALPEDVKEKN